jgi:hypothetical protein
VEILTIPVPNDRLSTSERIREDVPRGGPSPLAGSLHRIPATIAVGEGAQLRLAVSRFLPRSIPLSLRFFSFIAGQKLHRSSGLVVARQELPQCHECSAFCPTPPAGPLSEKTHGHQRCRTYLHPD